MNNLLELKGVFQQKKFTGKIGSSNLPKDTFIEVYHFKKLLDDLELLKSFWDGEKIVQDVFISVYYCDVIAKSKRLSSLFTKGEQTTNKSIVGAKFSNSDKIKHVITHYITMEFLTDAIDKIKIIIDIIKLKYNGKITHQDITTVNAKKINISKVISRSKFVNIIVDLYYIEKFGLEIDYTEYTHDAIISIYQTEEDTLSLMDKLGINLLRSRLFDKNTMLLTVDQLNILKTKAPYLISMGLSDLAHLTKTDFKNISESDIISIPSPTNEPTIGVIDTLFDDSVYFSEWVKYKDMVDPDIERSSEDYVHGTAVSSIIVDGATINPHLNDGCGRFKVRHFGVATSKAFSSFTILRSINEIIINNRDIKVWNLSLGKSIEIQKNCISPEGALLDKIQSENNVIFVIAGTNKKQNDKEGMAIGSPADSINAIVVNSIDNKNNPASYSRQGPVLSFFTKPDVAYYGGDKGNLIKVCSPTGEYFTSGTSFAAPWIARKLSYMIDILGFNREVAKALLIHAALGFKKQTHDSIFIGHGIVPVHINDIIQSKNDEIRFVISGVSEELYTYNYNLPVPDYNEKHPFIAKATLCYFPACSRNQGVDYTNTEFEFSFGRISDDDKIKSINKVIESIDTQHIYEANARKLYRKWDNVKNLIEYDTGKYTARKAYSKKLWGISIKTAERLEEKHGKGINFGLVITLKEINGKNRIDDFIQRCSLRGWLVNKIDIQTKLDIHSVLEEEVMFEE